MARTVALLLGVHAHQPVGNFDFVLDDAHMRCYGPFLRVLSEYSAFKFSIHVSGWLLDYMVAHYPDDMALLTKMVQRGQAELFGAGYTEPVLASIPARDRVGQIVRLSDRLEQLFGQRPQGAWLTERVWESTVVPSLAEAGIRYVTVDDYHFFCTGVQSSRLTGFFTTEEDGSKLDLFPISEPLRYRLPFSPIHEVVAYLEALQHTTAEEFASAVYFDDIEKFGVWPETYQWVYEQGWLRAFIEGVLSSSVIQPMRFSDFYAQSCTRGVVYLPTASYSEMNEWTLPVPAAHHYADLMHQEQQAQRWDISKPIVRGGIWRNFFMRYPESNWMHKRMLALAARYHRLPGRARTSQMLDALYEAQANDAYWHGLFGGLYLPHLRRAIYHALVKLEAMLDQVRPRRYKVQLDLDMDGVDEIFLHSSQLQAVVKLDSSASICELDHYPLCHNFGDTLTRQEEHYHRHINLHSQQVTEHDAGEGIANPHQRISYRHVITEADIVPDVYPRRLFRDFLYSGGNELPVTYRVPKSRGAKLVFNSEGTLLVSKSIQVRAASCVLEYRFDGDESGDWVVEINLAMPSCDGFSGRYEVAGQIHGGFGEVLQLTACSELVMRDDVLGGKVQFSSNVPTCLEAQPHCSVSQSEAGFEKIMQAVCIRLRWDLQTLRQGLILQLTVL